MGVFNLFLQFFTLLLSITSIVLVYLAVEECEESAFVPIYYFIGLGLSGVFFLSLSRLGLELVGGSFPLSTPLMQDLFMSYIVLFLFGSLWQSYEASICVPNFVDTE